MEKKLKKVQRGAAVGYVILKILRILLIIAAVVLIAGLVVLAVVNENDLPLEGVENGRLALDLQSLDLSKLGLENLFKVDGVLNLDLRDVKLVVLMLMGVGVLALAITYVLLLVAGKLFKHMKAEDTPFTVGNVRRLRLLGVFHIVIWAGGIALSYFVTTEIIRRLALPAEKVMLNLNVPALLLSLIYFLLARVFSFGQAQGEALQNYLPAPEPEPVPAPELEPVAEPSPKPLYQETIQEPEPEPEPVAEAAPADVEPPAAPVE